MLTFIIISLPSPTYSSQPNPGRRDCPDSQSNLAPDHALSDY